MKAKSSKTTGATPSRPGSKPLCENRNTETTGAAEPAPPPEPLDFPYDDFRCVLGVPLPPPDPVEWDDWLGLEEQDNSPDPDSFWFELPSAQRARIRALVDYCGALTPSESTCSKMLRQPKYVDWREAQRLSRRKLTDALRYSDLGFGSFGDDPHLLSMRMVRAMTRLSNELVAGSYVVASSLNSITIEYYKLNHILVKEVITSIMTDEVISLHPCSHNVSLEITEYEFE